MPKPEIVLPHGTEFVGVLEIASLIVKALNPVEYAASEARSAGHYAAEKAWRKQLAPEDIDKDFPDKEREKFHDANDGQLYMDVEKCCEAIIEYVQKGRLEARNKHTRNATTKCEIDVIVMLEELTRYVKPMEISVRVEDAPAGADGKHAAQVKAAPATNPLPDAKSAQEKWITKCQIIAQKIGLKKLHKNTPMEEISTRRIFEEVTAELAKDKTTWKAKKSRVLPRTKSEVRLKGLRGWKLKLPKDMK